MWQVTVRVFAESVPMARLTRLASALLLSCAGLCSAQDQLPNSPEIDRDKQINVNWLYGTYLPKEVPLEPLNSDQRVQLYIRQTFTYWGIYMKTTAFALRDQVHHTHPEWGTGFGGFSKRLGTRQAEFVIQNSVTSLGDGLLGWEPRYDRCRCSGLWWRSRHAIVRNFVTYDRTEKSLRPQLFTYLGAFTGSVTTTTWQPGNPNWRVKGYQAAITQVPVGIAVNLLGEFAPDVVRIIFHKNKNKQPMSQASPGKPPSEEN